ncbi:MAG: hypothetical protein J5844_02685 [Clostridia bacterium]|nr:hypothetical protein [Clostridia bacterium]
MKPNEKYSKENGKKAPSILPQKKKNLKKAVIIVSTALAVLVLLCTILYFVSEGLKNGRIAEETAGNDLNVKNYVNFYTPDYDVNIFEDAEYMKKNRNIYYEVPTASGSAKIVLDEYEKGELDAGQRFFTEYFDIVIGGEYEKYHKLFTDEYLKDPSGFEKHPADRKFTMQRIYDINVKELAKTPYDDKSYTYNGDPAVFGVYEVGYKIMKNDGEFRTDVESDMVIPLIFETVTTGYGSKDEKTLIKNIYRYQDITVKAE